MLELFMPSTCSTKVSTENSCTIITLFCHIYIFFMGKPGNDCNHITSDQNDHDRPLTISCTTFNVLAPIFKRLGGELRESAFKETWHSRNNSILDALLQLKSSIICLQEFWVGNEELVGMYEERLHTAGYLTYKLARTNNRGDGLLTAVHQSQFCVLNYMELVFNDIADRVAQILHVEICCNLSQDTSTSIVKEALIVNTHLIFPHDYRYCFLRIQQVYKILEYIRSYTDKYVQPLPVILCGDWNGSKKGNVYKFLRSQGFVSSYDIAHDNVDDNEFTQKWISHHNHRGNICGVDFIWLQNPQKLKKPLKESFLEAVLGNIKNLQRKVITGGGGGSYIPEIWKGSCITLSDFSQALEELGLIGHGTLTEEDVKELWERLDDAGRDGKTEDEEHDDKNSDEEEEDDYTNVMGFVVKKASLFPPEAEEGLWPDDYMLSDHAHLTVEFDVLEMPCD